VTKRILVASVGGTPDPIVNAIAQMAPAFVYFLCSTGKAGSDTQVEKTIVPAAHRAAGSYEIERVPFPDELREVVAGCARIEQKLTARFAGEEREILANYTGGTKTMAAGLVVFAVRAGWELQVNATGAERENLVKITGGDLPLPQDATILRVDEALETVREQAARHAHDAALDTLTQALTRMRPTPAEREALGRARAEQEMWAAWDRFDWDEALGVVGRNADLKERSAARLHRLIQTRELYEKNDAWSRRDLNGSELVMDLVENADRCAARRRYDDAAARLYRATELLAQVKLRRVHGVHTGAVEPSAQQIPATSRTWLATRVEANGTAKLGLVEAYRLLGDLGDPLGAAFAANEKRIRGWLLVRNESLLAHGLRPVTAARWQQHGEPWRAWLVEALQAA